MDASIFSVSLDAVVVYDVTVVWRLLMLKEWLKGARNGMVFLTISIRLMTRCLYLDLSTCGFRVPGSILLMSCLKCISK